MGVEIAKGVRSFEKIEDALSDAASKPVPPVDTMFADAGNLARQKWDGLLSQRLLRISYASLNLDVGEVMTWLAGHVRNDRRDL